jgi:dipeptidyl aminopeptidase/acylaminoacyl peptidase
MPADWRGGQAERPAIPRRRLLAVGWNVCALICLLSAALALSSSKRSMWRLLYLLDDYGSTAAGKELRQASVPKSLHISQTATLGRLESSNLAPSQERRVTLDDVLAFRRPVRVQLSPDGASILFTTQEAGLNGKGVYDGLARLWLIDVPTHAIRELAPVEGSGQWEADPGATWSHDGRAIYWLAPSRGHSELWRFDLATQRASSVTRGIGSVVGFSETPDGRTLAVVRQRHDDEAQRRLERSDEYLTSEHPNGLGVSDLRLAQPTNVLLMDLTTGASRMIVEGLPGATDLDWSRDGTRLTFIPRELLWGGVAAGPQIYDTRNGRLRAAFTAHSTIRRPKWSPDGQLLAWIEHTLYVPGGRTIQPGARFAGGLFSLLPVLTTGRPGWTANRRVTSDSAFVTPALPLVWNPSDSMIYVGARRGARTQVYAYDATSGSHRLVTPPGSHVTDFSLSADGRSIAAILSNANTPAEIYVGGTRGGGFVAMTAFGASASYRVGRVEPISWRSGDNLFDVQGFLVTPPDYDPHKRYPLVVAIHGGPSAPYPDDFWEVNFASRFNPPAAILAAQGYLVLEANPRGDPGYSVEFTKSLIARPGTADVEFDILAGVDALIRRGIADSTRIAVTGHSYGGFSVAWAIGHTQRFCAASLSDAPVDLVSDWGNNFPANSAIWDFLMGGSLPDRVNAYIAQSPIRYASSMRTPLLMRFAQRDAKIRDVTFLPQGKELFAVLRAQGVPVVMQVEPHSPHVLERASVYRTWVNRNLAWFAYWLMDAPDPLFASRAEYDRYKAQRPCGSSLRTFQPRAIQALYGNRSSLTGSSMRLSNSRSATTRNGAIRPLVFEEARE